MKKILIMAMVLVAFTFAGCKSTDTKSDSSKPVAAKAEAKKKAKKQAKKKAAKPQGSGDKTVYILVDDNVKADQRADKAGAQEQMGVWMERDLGKVLRKRLRCKTSAIKSASEFPGGANNYLLKVKIVKYNPGSYAARTFVGFGAGAASMDITYHLTDGSGKTVLKGDDGVGSGRDWRKVARKLDENMAKNIKGRI